MKNLLLACSAIFLISCENSTIDNLNGEDLNQKIIEIGLNYKENSDLQSKDKQPIDKVKAVKLGIADAIGGVLGSGFGPYGVLWGGFLATLGVEPSIRTPEVIVKKGNDNYEIVIPIDRNEDFKYGHFGKNHNILMKKAIDDDIAAVVVNNHLESQLKNLICSVNFYGETESEFIEYENFLVNLVNEIDRNIGEGDFNENYLLEAFSVNNFQKEIITTINNQLYLVNQSRFTDFLLSVEGEIINDSSISNDDRKAILIYVAILNSSTSLWLAN